MKTDYLLLAGIVALLCTLLLTGCSSVKQYPIIEISHKDSIQTKVTSKKSRCTIDIVNRFGIGRAIITLKSKEWPNSLTLHLHLKGLEGFSASTKLVQLDKFDFNITKDSVSGYYRVQLPKSLLTQNSRTINISWVDFYR